MEAAAFYGAVAWAAIALFSGISAAVIAASKGESGAAWFAMGVLFGPFALVWAIYAGNQCPYCKGIVHRHAIRCPHCTENLKEGASFFDKLGEAARWNCPECQRANPNSTYTCQGCGYRLR